MKKFLVLISLIALMVACQTPQQRSLKKANTMLNMAEIFINLNQLDRARTNTVEAMKIIDSYYRIPSLSNPELEIAYAKAHLTLFEIKNYTVFQSAEYRNPSFTRLPYMNQYIGYKGYVVKAKKTLLQTSKKSKTDLSNLQNGTINHLLGNINSYDLETLSQAEESYSKARSFYQKALSENTDYNIQDQIKKDLSRILLAQARMNLLQEKWATALNILESGDIGQNLDGFKAIFENLDNSKKKAPEKKYSSRQLFWGRWWKDREEKMKSTQEDDFNLKLQKFMLREYQQNLSYRIVCYHNLHKYKHFYLAVKILDQAYPKIADNMLDYFENQI